MKDSATARAAVDSLEKLRDKLKSAKEEYWAGQVEIQRQEVAAWLDFAQGANEKAVEGLRSAASAEDETEKNVVTPGPLAPARELLGEMLLEMGRPAEAFTEFDSTLTREPNRFWSLYGAAEAAKKAQR